MKAPRAVTTKTRFRRRAMLPMAAEASAAGSGTEPSSAQT